MIWISDVTLSFIEDLNFHYLVNIGSLIKNMSTDLKVKIISSF